jgi:hypothetical protein
MTTINVSRFCSAPVPARIPGQHLWAAVAMYRVNPAADTVHLDAESLMTIEVGCYWCERAWSRDAASKPCFGEPREEA